MLKTEGAIIDIISRLKALEGGTDDVRKARQTVQAAVQVPSGHGDLKWDEGDRSDCKLLRCSSRYAHPLEEGVHRKRAGDLLSADHHSGIRETDRGAGTVERP